VVSRGYVPEAGDLIWLDFDPQAGREQAGRRPAIALSPAAYNDKSGLAIVCPVTNRAKGYPFEVPLPKDLAVTGGGPCRSSEERRLEGTAGRKSRPSAAESFARHS